MRVGEYFLLGFEGLSIPAWIADFEQRFGLGGVILFDRDLVTGSSERNVQSPEQLHSLCAGIHGLPSRPLVFVDQEGGAVRRLKPNVGFADLPAQQQMAELSDHELRETLRASTEQMRRVGIDFNLAPVADLNTNPNNPNIGRIGRSFSSDPTVVRRCVHIVHAAATEVGLQLCLKHYPGLGAAEADTHTGDADLTRSLVEAEVEMFEELCATTIGHALLFSHATVRQWDREPVSLSAEAVRRVRRAVPDALIVTDDLQMAPIRNRYETLTAALRAVAAGVDLLCIGNNLTHEEQDCFAAAEAVEERVARDPVFSRAAVASQRRIRERKTVAQRGRLPE